jgi:predicted negative regulator of RcsB-dependent stress response
MTMATLDLEEQEQISALQHWWNQNGDLVTWIAVGVASVVVGYQGWQWYQRSQATQASAAYAAVQTALAERDAKMAREAAGELIEKFGGSAYAGMGALLSARVQVEAGDLKSARAQLAWAAENARDEELRDLARLRLAGVMVDEKSYDEALRLLEKQPQGAFAARFADLRGDIFALQEKRNEAKAAYQTALSLLDGRKQGDGPSAAATAAFREMVQLKLESLGETL